MTLKSCRNCSDALNILPVPLQGPVGEIEPRYIHAQEHQPFQDSLRTGGRSNGAHDLGSVGR